MSDPEQDGGQEDVAEYVSAQTVQEDAWGGGQEDWEEELSLGETVWPGSQWDWRADQDAQARQDHSQVCLSSNNLPINLLEKYRVSKKNASKIILIWKNRRFYNVI